MHAHHHGSVKLEPETACRELVFKFVCNQYGGRCQGAPRHSHQPSMYGVQPDGVQRDLEFWRRRAACMHITRSLLLSTKAMLAPSTSDELDESEIGEITECDDFVTKG